MSNSKNFLATLLISGCCLSHSLWADVDEREASFRPAIAVQYAPDAYAVQLGTGYWKNNTEHGQFYLSHFHSEDKLEFKSQSLGKQKYDSTRIGIEASSFTQGRTYQGGLFIYKNKSAANIDRAGVGAAAALGSMLTQDLRMLVGAEIMPEQFSTDWDADALFEYSFTASLSYRFGQKVEAGLNYRYGGNLGGVTAVNYNQAMFALAIRL